mmetsp:Transcript_48740/g.90354  ORF Transcript_48740/g.90354 Transcript_48740/m.90354 type:complete len:92 (+) Transcript_48740:245-520(+)
MQALQATAELRGHHQHRRHRHSCHHCLGDSSNDSSKQLPYAAQMDVSKTFVRVQKLTKPGGRTDNRQELVQLEPTLQWMMMMMETALPWRL